MSLAESLTLENDLIIVRTLGLTPDFDALKDDLPTKDSTTLNGKFVGTVSISAILGGEEVGTASASKETRDIAYPYHRLPSLVVQRATTRVIGNKPAPFVRINNIWVSPEHRGQGVGTAMLSEDISPFRYNKMIEVNITDEEMVQDDILSNWLDSRGFSERYDHSELTSPCLYAVLKTIQWKREHTHHKLTYDLVENVQIPIE